MSMTLQITPLDGETASTEAPETTLTPSYKWLGQALYGDQTEDAVHLLTDLNADGDAADAGEHNVFFKRRQCERPG